MKECDILGVKVKTYSDPPLHIFSGSGPSNPMIYAAAEVENPRKVLMPSEAKRTHVARDRPRII